jgi:L-ascorbate metabolism protein UlaG (beta-lactamase superfamily)
MVENIHWLGHASFKITGEKIVYIDPWKLKDGEPADIILITHNHYDHLSPEDVAKIATDKTWIVTTADAAKKLSGNIKTVKPGDSITVEGIKIEAVPAYNVNKNFHPKANNWVGFIVTINKKRVYHSGDCDFMPEMKNIKADIVLMPVGGTYTMTAEEAANAVNTINPKAAIPMHYDDIVGSKADAEKFKNLCKSPVVIKTPEN